MTVEDRRNVLGILACFLAAPLFLGPLRALLAWTEHPEEILRRNRSIRRPRPAPPCRSVKRHE